MKLSRIDRIQRTFAVDALFPQLTPGSVTAVQFALLAPRSESPVTGTVWTSPISVVSGSVTVLLAGPEADSTGALVVPATADLWAMATNAPETEAVKISDRISVAGSNATIAPPLPVPQVLSVNGKTGALSLTFSDVGAASTTDSRLSDARAATDTSVAALVNNGASSTTGALRAAYVPKWKASTAYTAGEPVINPSGQTVTANTSFTSGTTYSATNWTVVSGGGGGSTVTATDNGDGTVTLVAA